MIYAKLLLKFQQALQRCFFGSERMILCEGEYFLKPRQSLSAVYFLNRVTHLVNNVHMAVPCTTRETRGI